MNINILHFLLQLKNAALYKKEYVIVDYKPLYFKILKCLYEDGLIQTYFTTSHQVMKGGKIYKKKRIQIYLRKFNGVILLSNLKLISKFSKLKYITYKQLCKTYLGVNKVLYLSTNKGLYTNLKCKKDKIGGKLYYLC